MPYYELRCSSCDKEFNIKATIRERSEKLINCPDCASAELETVYRQVNILRYRGKDCDVCPTAASLGPGCGGGRCSLSS